MFFFVLFIEVSVTEGKGGSLGGGDEDGEGSEQYEGKGINQSSVEAKELLFVFTFGIKTQDDMSEA